MTTHLAELWTHLTRTPLLGVLVTIAAYLLAQRIHATFDRKAWANPVAIAIVLLAVLLAVTRTPYEAYFEGARLIHVLLGPATVALAVPLFEQRRRLRRLAVPLALALVAGVVAAIISAVGIGWLLGGTRSTLLSLASKSVTAPVAMSIAQSIGAVPALTVVLAIGTGITGALLALPVLRWLRIDCHATSGFALGLAAHGIGTARAYQINEEKGAFAGLAMCLTAIAYALVAPWLAPSLVGLLPMR
ncbi:MAG: LrgB family protein [Betaproteobacteria bacterium]|jgi:putative effector of murein hydrolase